MKNKKTSPVQSTKQRGVTKRNHTHCNSLFAQRSRILKHLQKLNSLTTQEARDLLDIMHPAGRIMELRQLGYAIKTHWEIVDTGKGLHRIAKYFLASGGQ